jgi:hypothetical protein
MDALGRFHVAYTRADADGTESLLHRNQRLDGTWTDEAEISSGGSYEYLSVETDSSGNAAYAFQDLTAGGPRLAVPASGGGLDLTWGETSAHGPIGFLTDLAIDEEDQLHLAWHDAYASTSSSSGEFIGQTTYAAPGVVGPEWSMLEPLSISIDIRADGVPCLAVATLAYTAIEYICRDESIPGPLWWTTLDDVLDEGDHLHVSMVHLSDGTPYIVSYEETAGALQVSTRHEGTWDTITIDTIDSAAWKPTIAVDSIDRVHIGYYSYADNALHYAIGR